MMKKLEKSIKFGCQILLNKKNCSPKTDTPLNFLMDKKMLQRNSWQLILSRSFPVGSLSLNPSCTIRTRIFFGHTNYFTIKFLGFLKRIRSRSQDRFFYLDRRNGIFANHRGRSNLWMFTKKKYAHIKSLV